MRANAWAGAEQWALVISNEVTSFRVHLFEYPIAHLSTASNNVCVASSYRQQVSDADRL